MLSPESERLVEAPPGDILVKRDEPPSQTLGGLWIPESRRDRQRMVLATVIDIHETAALKMFCELKVGDRVMLAASVGREILFGWKPENLSSLWVVPPEGVLCVFEGSVNEAEDLGSHFLRNQKSIQTRAPIGEAKWDEGDREGPR